MSIKEIREIFNLPDKKEEDSYKEESSLPFTEKVISLSHKIELENIAKTALESDFDTSSESLDINSEIEEKKIDKKQKTKDKVVEETTVALDKNTIEEKEELIENDQDETEEEVKGNQEIEISNYSKTFSVGNSENNIKWKLTCTSPKYERFYREKASLLGRVLIGGEILFSSINKELVDCRVNVSSMTNDINAIISKMSSVQDFKDRIKEIQVQINSQYFLLERGVTLLWGVLAQCHGNVERPVMKFDGVILEHMDDMEEYFLKLKGLKHSADIVGRNLDSAFDLLSRQITVLMPSRSVPTIYEKNVGSLPERQVIQPTNSKPTVSKEDLPDFSDFDGVNSEKTNVSSVKTEEKPKGFGIRKGYDGIPLPKK